MATCNTNISKEQRDSLLYTISAMIYANYPPYTIVNYICTESGAPAPGEDDWCIVSCVSACVYRYSSFNNTLSSYEYNTPITTYACVSSCFPIFPSSSCSGGESNSAKRGCSGNVKKWKQEHEQDTLKMLGFCNKSLLNSLERTFLNMSLTCQSFAMTIAMFAEHLSEITLADITKKIGAAIAWVAKTYKSIKDFINSIINWAKTSGEADIAGHFVKAVQDALTTLQGFLTDIIKDIGQYIEQIGEFLYDLADRMWDLKEIAFTIRSLSCMLNEIINTISWTFDRQTQCSKSSKTCTGSCNGTYSAQFELTSALDVGIQVAAAASQLSIDNLENAYVDTYITMSFGDNLVGVSIS
ncbi:MAG: hypothetical protein PHS54_00535 [Clostridia bacterium]|nr:hypothetical protein [Clostridia bacterium]